MKNRPGQDTWPGLTIGVFGHCDQRLLRTTPTLTFIFLAAPFAAKFVLASARATLHLSTAPFLTIAGLTNGNMIAVRTRLMGRPGVALTSGQVARATATPYENRASAFADAHCASVGSGGRFPANTGAVVAQRQSAIAASAYLIIIEDPHKRTGLSDGIYIIRIMRP